MGGLWFFTMFYHVLPTLHIFYFLVRYFHRFPSFSMIFHHFPSFSVQRSGPWSLNCQATRRRRWRNSWWSPCRLACWICGGFWCQTGVAISNHKKKQGSTEQSTTIWYNLLYLIYSIIYYNLPESTIISRGFFYFFWFFRCHPLGLHRGFFAGAEIRGAAKRSSMRRICNRTLDKVGGFKSYGTLW